MSGVRQVRRRAEPHVVRPFRRQRRLAGGTGNRPQPGPLDGADRPGCADRDHRNPQTTLLRTGGTDYPLGAPPHPASSPPLALGNPGQSRPDPAASDSTPSLTTRLQPAHPADKPKVPANSRQPGPRESPAAYSPRHLTLTNVPYGHKASPRRLKTDTGLIYPKSCPDHRLPLPIIAHSAPVASYLRWIRA